MKTVGPSVSFFLIFFTILFFPTPRPCAAAVFPSSFVVSPACTADTAQPPKDEREKFDPARDAAKDIADAIVVAKKDGKRILLDVGGEWCSWCHKLDKFFADHQDVADFLHANYVVVKVNYSKENKNEKVLSAYPAIEGYPHLFVLDGAGILIHSQDTGALESGDHHDHDKVLSFLKAWAPGTVH